MNRVRVAFSIETFKNCIVNNFSRATKIFAEQRSEFTIHLFWSVVYALHGQRCAELMPVCSFHLPRFTAFISVVRFEPCLSRPTVNCSRAKRTQARSRKSKTGIYCFSFLCSRVLSSSAVCARERVTWYSSAGFGSVVHLHGGAWGMNTWWMITKCIHFNVARSMRHNIIVCERSERSY